MLDRDRPLSHSSGRARSNFAGKLGNTAFRELPCWIAIAQSRISNLESQLRLCPPESEGHALTRRD